MVYKRYSKNKHIIKISNNFLNEHICGMGIAFTCSMSQIAKKLPESPVSITGIEAKYWRQFAKNVMQLLASAKNTSIPVQKSLRSITHKFYDQLVDDPLFREQFRAWSETDKNLVPDWSAPLYEDDVLRAGLLGVYRDKPVPFHDHPGSAGITLILSGIARIHYADLMGKTSHSPLTPLKLVRTRERFPGEVCWFFENERNIHSIEAVTPGVMLLVIHLPPVNENKQALYFPVSSPTQIEGEHIMARRIELNALKTKTDF
jgi:hypothetical protein